MPRSALPGRDRDGHPPLIITSTDDLLDDLLRLAAASGLEPRVAPDPTAARGHYSAAPLVLIGIDQASACVSAKLPRRSDVIIVCREADLSGIPEATRTSESGGPSDPAHLGPEPAINGVRVPASHTSAGPDPWSLAERLDATHVAMLPAAESWLTDRLAACLEPADPAPVVAVLGGRGGAGASVLAAGLAVTAASFGRRVLLVDADPLGGGLDLLLGWEDDGGLRWPELAGANGRLDPSTFLTALPGRGDLALVSFDRRDAPEPSAQTMAAVLAAGRAARDLVVVDVPRRFDPTATMALQSADLGLLVVPADVRAATAAARVAADAADHCGDLRLVVRGPSPGRLSADEIGEALRLPVAGTLRPELGLPATLEGGMPPTASGRGPLATLCRRLVEELCPRPEVAQ